MIKPQVNINVWAGKECRCTYRAVSQVSGGVLFLLFTFETGLAKKIATIKAILIGACGNI